MSILTFGVPIAAVLAAILLSLSLKYGSPAMLTNLPGIRIGLLILAAICSGLLSLICLAAAAWGANTRLPWGLGILMYLIPVLSVPSFVILKFGSVRTLSQVLWIMTVASSLAFYFGDRADRLASGVYPITDPMECLGMFANAFTIMLVGISVLVQTASLCASREARLAETTSISVD